VSVIGQEAGINHGTPAGYKQHLRRQIDPCDECRDANRAAATASRQRTQARRTLARAAAMPTPRQMYIQQYSPHPPGWQDPAWGVPIEGRDLRVGDVIVHLGKHYPIDHIEPYKGSLANVLSVKGESARTAWSGTWDMAIGPDRTIRILPREGR